MLKRIHEFTRTPSFLLTVFLAILLLAGASIVVGQGELTGFSYLPVVINDAVEGPGPTPTLPPPSSSDWAMVAANPQRTSWSPEEVSGNLQLQWYRPIEAYIPQNSQVIAANGLLYISTSNGLYALHAATGDMVWRYDTELPLGNSPTIADGVVYVGGYDHKLHALDALTGTHLWAFSGAGAGYSTNPLVQDGKVFVGNRDGKMYAVGVHGTAQQGQLVWQFDAGAPIYVSAAYSDGKIYFAADNYGFALNASNGNLIWRSGRLPGEAYQSYWVVVYQDKVVFAGSESYRNGTPGLGSIQDESGTEYGKYTDIERDDLFVGLSDGDLIGSTVSGQTWANGHRVLDITRILQYHEDNPNAQANQHKPWRRVMVMLNADDGSEYTFDTDGDGYDEFIPAGYVGAQSGNRYPPLVGPDNRLYFTNVFQKYYIPQGQVMGWETGTPYVSLVGGQGAVDEPQAISAGGNLIYRNLCCDRVGDWSSIVEPRASGQLWSYNLSDLAPGYDDRTWEILPGWPRLKGWYSGDSDSINAAYHNHGDQNPIIPYQGRLYVHRSNVIFAFGTGPGPGRLPLVEINAVQEAAPSLSESQLEARLEEEVRRIVDAGHLRPGYYSVAQFQVRGMSEYFENPGDTIYTLTMAYAHLSPALQAEVRTYLQQEFNTYFDPAMYARIGWSDGAPRENMLLPPEVAADMAGIGPSQQAGPGYAWQYPQHNFYAMWKYAQIFPGQAGTAYDLAKSKLQVPMPANSDYLQQQPYEHNAWIAGYIGFLELQDVAGMSGTDSQLRAQVSAELNRLLQLRVALFSKDSYWQDDRYFKKHIDVARNFIFLVPELGDYLHQNLLAQVQQAVDEYEYVAPYWFVSRYEAAIGEGVMHNLYTYNALFNARAYALHQSQTQLTKYLDVPAFPRGDLFYIQNIVAALEAPN